jgi:hypothetical protein
MYKCKYANIGILLSPPPPQQQQWGGGGGTHSSAIKCNNTVYLVVRSTLLSYIYLSRLIPMPVKELFPSKEIVVKFANGDIKQTIPTAEGNLTIYFYQGTAAVCYYYFCLFT